MICGIGVDCVEIERFDHWHTYSYHKLSRIFSDDEITYCLKSLSKSAERFAVRFAAKEALLKAMTQAGLQDPLLYICKNASVIKDKQNNAPLFALSDQLTEQLPKQKLHLSLTHTKAYATAFVAIEKP